MKIRAHEMFGLKIREVINKHMVKYFTKPVESNGQGLDSPNSKLTKKAVLDIPPDAQSYEIIRKPDRGIMVGIVSAATWALRCCCGWTYIEPYSSKGRPGT